VPSLPCRRPTETPGPQEEPAGVGARQLDIRRQDVGRKQIGDRLGLGGLLQQEEPIADAFVQDADVGADPAGGGEQERAHRLVFGETLHRRGDEVVQPSLRIGPSNLCEAPASEVQERALLLERLELLLERRFDHVCEDKPPWTFRGRSWSRTTTRPRWEGSNARWRRSSGASRRTESRSCVRTPRA